MASFKTLQDYEVAKREWLDAPHAAYIQKTGDIVRMNGTESLIFEDSTVASIIGSKSYNAVAKIQDLGTRFNGTNIKTFNEFRFFNCILDIREKAFENCATLTEIKFPRYVYTIGDHAFSHCCSLKKVVLGHYIESHLEIIAESAFTGCSNLENITIPITVKAINDYAFYNCSMLQEVDMLPLSPPYIHDGTIFKGCENLRSINVWPGCLKAYTEHPVWGKFASIIKEKRMTE